MICYIREVTGVCKPPCIPCNRFNNKCNTCSCVILNRKNGCHKKTFCYYAPCFCPCKHEEASSMVLATLATCDLQLAIPHAQLHAAMHQKRHSLNAPLVLPHAPYSPDMSPPDFDLFPKLKEPMRGRLFSSLKELFTDSTRAIRYMNKSGVLDGIIILPKRWDSVNVK